VRRAPAIVRRLLPHRLALAAAAATVLLAATLLAALASFSATVSSHAVRTTLAGNSGTTISVTSPVDSAAAATRADGRLRASLRRALAGVPLTIWTALSSDYLDMPAGLGPPHAQTHVISLADLPGHAALLAGSWPGRVPGGTVPAAAPESLARGLRLAVGQTIRLRDGMTGTVIAVRITGIFGPRHSGKTTLLSILGGLDRPSSGRVEVAGRDVTAMTADGRAALLRDTVAFIFQAFGLIPILSAAENVGLPMRLARTDPAVREQRSRALLGLVGLDGRAGLRPYELSGGEQQRVAIARALANSPELLLADEPTGQLDSDTAGQIMRLLRSIVHAEGVTAIVATHDPVLIALADRVLTLKDGELQET
jgi:putative ABC transport system ATP-binding protein